MSETSLNNNNTNNNEVEEIKPTRAKKKNTLNEDEIKEFSRLKEQFNIRLEHFGGLQSSILSLNTTLLKLCESVIIFLIGYNLI